MFKALLLDANPRHPLHWGSGNAQLGYQVGPNLDERWSFGFAEVFVAYRSWYGFLFNHQCLKIGWFICRWVSKLELPQSPIMSTHTHTHIQDLPRSLREEPKKRGVELHSEAWFGPFLWEKGLSPWLKNSRNFTDSFPSAWCCKSASIVFFNISHSRRRHTITKT